jgi:hypothetical protein
VPGVATQTYKVVYQARSFEPLQKVDQLEENVRLAHTPQAYVLITRKLVFLYPKFPFTNPRQRETEEHL